MKILYPAFLRTILLIGFLMPIIAANAQRIDSTFWMDAQQYTQVYRVQPLPDSSCLVAGAQWYVDGNVGSNLVRLLPNGQLDQEFVQQLGGLEFSQPAYGQLLPQLLQYPDGRLLVVAPDQIKLLGYPQLNASVVRLLPTGQPDVSFSLRLSGRRLPNVRAAALQPDGKILLAGDGGTDGPRLVRLNADGTLDTAFAPMVGTARATDAINAVVVQPDGRILIGGFFNAPANALARLLANGASDPSFQASVAGGADVQELLLRPGGQLVVAARASVTIQGYTAGIQQLLPSGQRDASFQAPSTYGVIAQPNGRRTHLLPDGRLVVLPSQPLSNAPPIRLLANGQPDPSFQPPARLPLNMQGADLDAAGRLLIHGQYTHEAGLQGPLQRLLPSGQLDTQYLPQLYRPGAVSRMLRLADRRTVVVGRFDVLGGHRAGNVACLLATDAPDTAFMRRSPFISGAPERVAVQPSGKILVGGSVVVQARQPWHSLVRLHPDGRLDTTFRRIVAGGYALGGMAVQSNGGIIIGGGLAQAYSNHRFARLGPDGALDNTFVISMTLDSWLGEGRHVAVQPDGRLLLAGRQVHRVLSSGQYDPTYQALEANSYSSLLVRDMVLLPTGKLVLCGQMPTAVAGQRGTIAQLLANGRLDTAFHDRLALQFDARSLLQSQASGDFWVGGYFQSLGTASSIGLVRINQHGEQYSVAAIPGIGSVYTCSETMGGKLLIGGEFICLAASGMQQTSLARLTSAGPVLPVLLPISDAKLDIHPNPAREQLTISWEPSRRAQRVQLLTITGQTLIEQRLASAGNTLIWTLPQLPAGVYLLRVEYADGPVTRRVIVE